MSSILEEANRLLKAMGGSENAEASTSTSKPVSSSTTTVAADQNREDMMEKLQQQLNALRQNPESFFESHAWWWSEGLD